MTTIGPGDRRAKANQNSGRKIRRKCSCGRIIVGNAAWWAHNDAAERRGDTHEHRYQGRA